MPNGRPLSCVDPPEGRDYAPYDAASGKGGQVEMLTAYRPLILIFFPTKGDENYRRRDARPQAPLPERPPWTCFLGNLAFDVTERDIATLFGELKVSC